MLMRIFAIAMLVYSEVLAVFRIQNFSFESFPVHASMGYICNIVFRSTRKKISRSTRLSSPPVAPAHKAKHLAPHKP